MSAPRKSRRARSRLSETQGEPKKWNPTKADWLSLEKACDMPRGQHFDDELRSKIHTAVTDYFRLAPYESAPFIDDFVTKLRKAQRLADELAKVVYSFGSEGGKVAPHWEMYFPQEREEEESLLKAPVDENGNTPIEHIFAMPLRRGRDHRDFEEVVHTIGSALDSALVEEKESKSSGWREGEEWKKLITRLASAFSSSGLKVSTRKDPNYQEAPFVRFFRALQLTFDEEFRRHEANSGLSQAIYQVLKSKGKTRKRGANLSRRKVD